jgi:hypothetical protein
MGDMIKHNQDGAVSGLTVSLILTVLLLIAAIAFGGWAFTSRQDYKDHSDAKSATAAAAAVKVESKKKDAEFVQKEKNPFRTYNGPAEYGSIDMQFPKTWSGYVASSGSSSGSTPIDGYWYPNIVPTITDQSANFAVRLQVVNQPYAEVLKTLQGQQSSSQNAKGATPLVITPYTLKNVPKVVGIRASGSLTSTKVGTMVVLPMRTNTLKIWTDGTQFVGDFDSIILPNLVFSP